ncbi:peroxiredoxin [Dyadobacter sp. CY356]|uniref:peroxiredoxin family protein n=1 Tax=Dyadobacter sp. CY356 TaxID=2906442 RepID=UPI001F1978D7|nr:TlpA disulfide reductase family protein [Dyadobacter sp. CY356]MCF0054963.1 TlpA family protein disulfide reductase [Dyadobacter sp. CY356]
MKCKTVFLCAFALLVSCNQKHDQSGEIISLPLTIVDGFGPFDVDYLLLSPEYRAGDPNGDIWTKTYLPVKGIPKNWKNVVKSMVNFDVKQLIYQNYQSGNLNQNTYENFQESWEWKPDEKYLSKTPIKCFVYVVRGLDESGKVAVMIDTNNNLDFEDENPFYPESARFGPAMRNISNITKVSYETFREGKTQKKQLPLVVKYLPDQPENRNYVYSIPQYAQTILKHEGRVYELAVRRGFDAPNYEAPEIVIINKEDSIKKYSFFDGIGKGELLSLNETSNTANFRNLGVDPDHRTLLLEIVKNDKKQSSKQVGYLFKPFESKEFQTGKILRISDYKGKYVFIDFWGTWCKPCVEELPDLQNTYKTVNKKNIEFISIACLDSPEKLSDYLKKHPLPWPQILSDKTNKLMETYDVQGFPFNLIIGPDGKIVARNLHNDALKKKLAELGNL